jgi:hypothetical protein
MTSLVSCAPVLIDLTKLEDSDFTKLEAQVGDRVCLEGIVFNDDLGVYILLAPFEDESGVIMPSPPRVLLNVSDAQAQQISNARTYRACGVIENMTAPNCRHRDCSQFHMDEVELRLVDFGLEDG